MKKIILSAVIWTCLSLVACTSARTNGVSASMKDSSPLTTKNMEAVKGQTATCAGPSVKTFDLDLIETNVNMVRMYFVNVGPGVASAHVIGSILDRVYDGREPISYQKWNSRRPAAGRNRVGLDAVIPEDGVFPFVDHDKLAFLSYGLSLAIATGNVSAMAH
jgi:hypothetical protein